MEPFKLCLPNGAIISGRYNFPPRDSKSAQIRPLIVCIPGGSYDSRYFDVQGVQSICNLSSCLKIPVIAIDRPGYGASTLAPDVENAPTYAQGQGIYLNSVVFPALWKTFADRAEASGIVLLSHSIGAMIATIAAGSYTGLEDYPLAGIITSGIGSELVEGHRQGMLHLLDEPAEFVQFEATPKDAIMLQLPHMNLAPLEMRQFTEQLNQPVPQGELRDINTTWLGYWKDYSSNVKVPLLYGLGEFDGLWTCSAETLAVYKAAFPKSPTITCEIIPMAPHCMELSFQSQAWYLKCFAFAIECIVTKSIRSTRMKLVLSPTRNNTPDI
ncbi:Alpha/Beta hydrolase protein [Aspergillus pseudocaelatus]|uniref:Alpha/Beta hydrolase protein n=1 Tax=Aspergillus pseudocaelatus TaxID=1825620 RepID=A0ABQ6WF59_9EURO|nr:Alpha/Beta hydrolase protein [Aspergillus pseudocaelatus]